MGARDLGSNLGDRLASRKQRRPRCEGRVTIAVSHVWPPGPVDALRACARRTAKGLRPMTRSWEHDGMRIVRLEQQAGYHEDQFDWIEVVW